MAGRSEWQARWRLFGLHPALRGPVNADVRRRLPLERLVQRIFSKRTREVKWFLKCMKNYTAFSVVRSD